MYYEKFMNNIYTSSGWASDSSFSSSQGCLKGNWHTQPQEGGVVLFNHNGELVVDGGDECRHLLVIGSTGTGKSRLVILPSLVYSLHAKAQRSFVIFDVKGELEAHSANVARVNGYNILNINFRSPPMGITGILSSGQIRCMPRVPLRIAKKLGSFSKTSLPACSTTVEQIR